MNKADEVISVEEVIEAARMVLDRGVGRGELDPANPINQVLVAGASLIIAATDAGLGPDDVFGFIHSKAQSVPAGRPNLRLVKTEDTGGTGVGGYL